MGILSLPYPVAIRLPSRKAGGEPQMWCTGLRFLLFLRHWILFCEEYAIMYLLRLKRGTSVPARWSARLYNDRGKQHGSCKRLLAPTLQHSSGRIHTVDAVWLFCNEYWESLLLGPTENVKTTAWRHKRGVRTAGRRGAWPEKGKGARHSSHL